MRRVRDFETQAWRVTCPTTPGTPMTSFFTVMGVRDLETSGDAEELLNLEDQGAPPTELPRGRHRGSLTPSLIRNSARHGSRGGFCVTVLVMCRGGFRVTVLVMRRGASMSPITARK